MLERASAVTRAAREGAAAYARSLWSYRHFGLCLVKADLRHRYRRSVLGLAWSMLQPLCMTLVLALVYRKAFRVSFWDFAPILLTGLAFWNLISHGVLQGCQALVCAESYLRQEPVPLLLFPLRTALTIGFHYLASLPLAVGYAWAFHGARDPLALLSLVPTLGLLLAFVTALATLAAVAYAYFPDTRHLAEIGLQALFFLTPVAYPAWLVQDTAAGTLLRYNPLSVLLGLVREPVVFARVPGLAAYGQATLVVALAALLAGLVLARVERRLIFAL